MPVNMVELEETWTEKSFYDKPLTIWLGEERCDEKDSLLLDIFTAASIGCCQRVKDILKEDKNASSLKNHGGWTGLMYAAYYAHSDVINVLLEANASVHLRNGNGCNALMMAVMCGNDYGVEILIKAGSILETRDNRDWTALFHAVNSGHHTVIETLLKHRANLNSCERTRGMTPLMYAAQLGDATIVSLLLRGGAVVSLTNHQGHTAGRIAQDAGFPDIAANIAQWDLPGLSGPSILDGPAAVEVRRTHQQPQTPRGRGSVVPCVDNASIQPTDLETLLDQIGLSSYMSIFREQDVDLQIFLTLTDQDLKECGIQKLGPRRKMTSAIARWHSNAPLRSTAECAYADKLEVEMQELGVKLTQALHSLHQTKTQVNQENDLRVVTEGWVVEARGRLHECHQRCQMLIEQVAAVRRCTSVLCAQASLGKLPLIQPTLISTIVDTLTMIAAQADTLMALTDPSVPRGPSNPSSPRKQGYRSYPSTPR
nr:ankyrin repeat and SAM domain-containing protein 3-like [Procambarus clarkii]